MFTVDGEDRHTLLAREFDLMASAATGARRKLFSDKINNDSASGTAGISQR